MIVEDQGRYLLLRRPEGDLVFPGGFMRWREHPTQTAVREFKEETGLQVELRHVIGCYSNPSASFGRMSTLMLLYCGAVSGGKIHGSIEGLPCWIEESVLLDMIDFRNLYLLNDYRQHREQHGKQQFSGVAVREMTDEKQ